MRFEVKHIEEDGREKEREIVCHDDKFENLERLRSVIEEGPNALLNLAKTAGPEDTEDLVLTSLHKLLEAINWECPFSKINDGKLTLRHH